MEVSAMGRMSREGLQNILEWYVCHVHMLLCLCMLIFNFKKCGQGRPYKNVTFEQ